MFTTLPNDIAPSDGRSYVQPCNPITCRCECPIDFIAQANSDPNPLPAAVSVQDSIAQETSDPKPLPANVIVTTSCIPSILYFMQMSVPP